MSRTRKSMRIALAGALAAATAIVAAGPASAVTLAGEWAPFTRCPVDDPVMLAADGAESVALCLVSSSPSGSIKLGNTTATTGASDLQFGLISAETMSLVAPPGAGIVAAPAQVPGGLLGLMCPSGVPLVSAVCRQATDNDLNNVTATVRPAGAPSEFDLEAGAGVGQPILTLPVKIHLENPLLGADCFIGSNTEPILLRPRNLTAPTGSFARFDGDGTANPTGGVMLKIGLHGAAQGDDSFAVPGATGCGLLGLLSPAINIKTGLPSAAGNNNLVLDDTTTFLGGLNTPRTFAPDAGRQLSVFWHSAARS